MITCNRQTKIVYVGGIALDLGASLELRNHSPDGFSWGYLGSGPSQLALALLLHFTDEEFALRHYQEFKFDVVARWSQYANVRVPNKIVTNWIKAHRLEVKA